MVGQLIRQHNSCWPRSDSYCMSAVFFCCFIYLGILNIFIQADKVPRIMVKLILYSLIVLIRCRFVHADDDIKHHLLSYHKQSVATRRHLDIEYWVWLKWFRHILTTNNFFPFHIQFIFIISYKLIRLIKYLSFALIIQIGIAFLCELIINKLQYK